MKKRLLSCLECYFIQIGNTDSQKKGMESIKFEKWHWRKYVKNKKKDRATNKKVL